MTPLEQAARPISLAVSKFCEDAKLEREARERTRPVWAAWLGFVLALYLAALVGVMMGAI